MARFSGRLGFAESKETSPGIVKEVLSERVYFGDLLRNRHSQQNTEQVHGTISIQNQVSIVADPYVFENYFALRYVVWQNIYWEVTAVDVEQYPRITLTLGGVYNGETADTTY